LPAICDIKKKASNVTDYQKVDDYSTNEHKIKQAKSTSIQQLLMINGWRMYILS